MLFVRSGHNLSLKHSNKLTLSTECEEVTVLALCPRCLRTAMHNNNELRLRGIQCVKAGVLVAEVLSFTRE